MKHDRLFLDLHCDTLYECLARGVGLDSEEMPHIALRRLPQGSRLCQCLAIFVPDEYRGEAAWRYFDAAYQVYCRELSAQAPQITSVTRGTEILPALKEKRFAVVLTVEGGAVLAGRREQLSELYARGVRMMTLTWNGENELAGGADTTLGFTALGRQVVADMEALGMVVDISHLSDTGFWELCEFATKPFAASHSNARAVCPHRRNLTDKMFLEIARRGGIVGLNYSDGFIREGGGSTNIDDLLRHVHHFLALGGENAIALGSDFDGTDVPVYLNGLDKIGNLVEALEKSGIPFDVVEQILFGNAHRYFCTAIG